MRDPDRLETGAASFPALMVVYMTISDASWIEPYFAAVPALLAEYGASPLAGSRQIKRVEGTLPAPDRIAVLGFPSLDAIDRFMADDRYQSFRRMRERGATSDIFVFENAAEEGELA